MIVIIIIINDSILLIITLVKFSNKTTMNTSCLSHRNYFINLRKSYHMNLSLATANETQIFLGQSEGFNNKDFEFAGL